MATIAKKSGNTKTNKKAEEPKDFQELAKQKIDELLNSIELTPTEKKEAQNVISKEEMGGINWLSEQVDVLTKENQKLKNEIVKVKQTQNAELADIKNKITIFYNDIHFYFNKWGGRITLNQKEFSDKFIKLFPFLKK